MSKIEDFLSGVREDLLAEADEHSLGCEECEPSVDYDGHIGWYHCHNWAVVNNKVTHGPPEWKYAADWGRPGPVSPELQFMYDTRMAGVNSQDDVMAAWNDLTRAISNGERGAPGHEKEGAVPEHGNDPSTP